MKLHTNLLGNNIATHWTPSDTGWTMDEKVVTITHTYSHAHYKLEFISGSGTVPVHFRPGSGKLNFVVISPYFTIFMNVVHCLEPGETPSYSASHQAPNYVQRA